jgi:hypothetical protein
VKQEWEPDELIAHWTLVEDDWRLLGNKTGVTRLGFAVILKYFEMEGRFPAYPEEILILRPGCRRRGSSRRCRPRGVETGSAAPSGADAAPVDAADEEEAGVMQGRRDRRIGTDARSLSSMPGSSLPRSIGAGSGRAVSGGSR